MRPELVTIQKVRFFQLGAAALGVCILSFYAGYCYRGPGPALTQSTPQDSQTQAPPAEEAPNRVITRVDPEKIRERAAEELPTLNQPEEPRVERVFEKASTPPPAKTPPAPKTKAAPSAPPPALAEKPAEAPAPAKAPPAPKEKPTPSGDPKFTVQVASFKDSRDADKMVDSLVRDNYSAYTRTVVIKGEKWYRVRVGAYPTASEARKTSIKLNAEKRTKSLVLKYD